MVLYKEKDYGCAKNVHFFNRLDSKKPKTIGPALPQDSQVNFLHNSPGILIFSVNQNCLEG